MESTLKELVRNRAQFRCEYCRMPQDAVEHTFHIEHIRAKQHSGESVESNLALSCDRCNCFKGTNLVGIDPLTDKPESLFHPRRQVWKEHFQLVGSLIVGISPCGRATANLLRMNAPRRVALRAMLLDEGMF